MVPGLEHLTLLSPLLAVRLNSFWYALPLILALSLVYAGTRHERPPQIAAAAVRIGVLITGFMLVVFGIFYFLSADL